MAVLQDFHPLLSARSQKVFVASAMLLFAAAPSRSEAAVVLSAGTILGGTPGRSIQYSITNAFDQSGLSTGYTSGVTDFDTYIASTTHGTNTAFDFYLANDFVFSGFITIDLGSVVMLEGLALWNWGSAAAGPGIEGMRVYSSPDATFATTALVGDFTFVRPGGAAAIAQVRQLTTPTSTRYVRLETTGPRSVGFGELAFAAVEPVPEPSSLLLLGSGAWLVLLRRRASAV